MTQDQTLDLITVDALLDRVRGFRQQGCRLVQICATRLPEQFELTYSFDLDHRLSSVRFHLPPADPHMPSISSIYACAVLYENEIQDLFNVRVDGMALDFQGNFYRTAVKYAFGSTKPPAPKPAPPAPAAAAPNPAAVPIPPK